MHRLRRSSVLGGVVLATMLVVQPGLAAAATSSVTLTIVDAVFKGKVTSPNAACIAGRYVDLVRIEPDGTRVPITMAVTKATGRYRTTIPMQSGKTFVARVRRSTPAGIVCKSATSPKKIA